MKEGPDIAPIAALIGDPARANMLVALMSGKALTATEMSHEAGVSLQTTSSHLKQLVDGQLLMVRKSGRHRYFTLAGPEVAQLLEYMMGLAAGTGQTRTRTGPKNEELRKARVCYNHLAGNMGIELYDSLVRRGFLQLKEQGIVLTDAGENFAAALGINLEDLQRNKAPLCRECLDWSERRSHLAGSLGRALLTRFEELGWAKRVPETRIVRFSQKGEKQFYQTFT